MSSSPRRIRQHNEVAALRSLYRFGRLSRAGLARRLGLNRSSVGHIVAGLVRDGLVREVADERRDATDPGRAGRPGIALELVPDARYFFGMEIGVEHITTAVVDLGLNLVATRREPFDGPAVDVEAAVARGVAIAFESVPAAVAERCEGFGVSTPAQTNRHGIVRVAPLLGWRDVDLAAITRDALPIEGVPVLAENEANAFAIGATYGPDEAQDGVTVFLVLESGVGGGIVLDGELFRGGHGLAGEIGHLLVDDADGVPRALEQLIGLEAILPRYRTVHGGRTDDPFERFLDDVRDRVPSAVAIAEDWARALAFGLVQVCRVIDANAVVLGGSVAALHPLMAARVDAHVRAVQEDSFPMPTLSVSDPDSPGPAFGAACMLHQRYLSVESQRFGERAVMPRRSA